MEHLQYFIDPIQKHYVDFAGRATRKQYWMFVLFSVIISIVLGVVDAVIGKQILGGIYSLAVLLPSLAIAARRLHDVSKSAWWLLIALIPLAGALVLIYFLVQDSHPDNDFGPSPKG